MERKAPSPGNIVIMAAGAVMFVGSFLAFYKYSAPKVRFGNVAVGGSVSRNAWSGDLFFPVTIIPVVLGVVMAVHVALTSFGRGRFPEPVLGFRWNQIHLAFGAQATLMMLAFLIQDRSSLDTGLGFWLMFLSAAALLVGAILRTREPAPAS